MKKIFLAAFIVLGSLFAPIFVQGQSNERTVNLYHWRNEVIKILSTKIKGKEIKPNQSFVDEDNDWFRDLTVEVENISDKTIVYINVSISFPIEPGRMKHPAQDSFSYGPRKLELTNEKVIDESQPPIKPGERVTIKLADYAGTRRFLDKVGYSQSLKEFRIDVSTVLFEDDTKWYKGMIMIRDPDIPGKWIPRPRSTN